MSHNTLHVSSGEERAYRFNEAVEIRRIYIQIGILLDSASLRDRAELTA